MNTHCNAEPLGDGFNMCRPCGLQWHDDEGNRCHRTEKDSRKFIILDIQVKEVQSVSVDEHHKINPLHVIRDVTPNGEGVGILEAVETVSEKRVIDLEYFTAQENGQFQGIYLGYDKTVESKLGFMFDNFRKQRIAINHLKDELNYKANEAKAANARVEAQVKTEVRIKEANFWRRLAFTFTGDTKWIATR